MASTRQITVRMPLDLALGIKQRGKNAAFIIEAVREKLRREEQAEIEKGLLCLGDDDEASDISDYAPAQARVIARGD